MIKHLFVRPIKEKFLFLCAACLVAAVSSGQDINRQLQKAFQQFEADSQLKHAVSSLYVIDANTGEVVFDKNSQVGLAPASTQKIITSVTAFELLGKGYRYKTELGYRGQLDKGELNGDLYIIGNGDPTLGSGRWESTRPGNVLHNYTTAMRNLKIKSIRGAYDFVTLHFESQGIPDGWIWEDVGNYYGAGAMALNWRENQYDLYLRSGDRIGDTVSVVRTDPELTSNRVYAEATAAAKGTGDNAYIYLPLNSTNMVVRGTIPVEEKNFRISGSIPDPANEFFRGFLDSLLQHRIEVRFSSRKHTGFLSPTIFKNDPRVHPVYTHYSPSLDSIVYWFNKKSINLYGEALVKTFALEKQGFGSTDSGVAIVRQFWKEKGLDPEELNIYDGSGLSPLNRVTTHAQVEILKYAKSRDWFTSFYNSLPIYNDMHIKSGTISDVKGFCGYHQAKDGKEYIFSFLVNNYSGRSSALVGKMYKVLDVLK